MLFLTAKDAIEDRVNGLELGADDYLVKPFAFAELLARVRTLLRRGPMREAESYASPIWKSTCCAAVSAAGPAHRPDQQGVRAAATARQSPGRSASRTLIASQVWDLNFDSDTNIVEVAVRRLRAKSTTATCRN